MEDYICDQGSELVRFCSIPDLKKNFLAGPLWIQSHELDSHLCSSNPPPPPSTVFKMFVYLKIGILFGNQGHC